jgi:hypothetical protein
VTVTPTQRINDLESAAFRTDRRFDDLTERVELIAGGLNELAIDVRALQHDVTEIKQIQQQQGQVQQQHTELLREILAAIRSGNPQ